MRRRIQVSAFAGLLVMQAAHATPVTIVNGDFEATPLVVGSGDAVANDAPDWNYTDAFSNSYVWNAASGNPSDAELAFMDPTTTVHVQQDLTSNNPGVVANTYGLWTIRIGEIGWRTDTQGGDAQITLSLIDLGNSGAVLDSETVDLALRSPTAFDSRSVELTDTEVQLSYDITAASSGNVALRIQRTDPDDGLGGGKFFSTMFVDGISAEAAAGQTYAGWISGFPGVGAQTGFNEDPDGDGIDNGVEAFMGTDPAEAGSGITGVSRSGTVTTFTHPQADLPPTDVTASYEWSLNLEDWYAGDNVDGPPGGPTILIPPPTVVAGEATATATASEVLDRLFIRIIARQ